MRKIYDLNNSGASADFRCKKARNHGDCRDSVKVYYLPSNSAKFGFYHLTRNQLYLTVPWVRIPPAPPDLRSAIHDELPIAFYCVTRP